MCSLHGQSTFVGLRVFGNIILVCSGKYKFALVHDVIFWNVNILKIIPKHLVIDKPVKTYPK